MFLLAVDKTAKVWLVAFATHVEANLGLSELHWLPAVVVTRRCEAWIPVEVLRPHYFHCLNLKIRAQNCEFFEFLCDFVHVVGLDWSLASWAAHEGKSNPQRGPLMLQKFNNAISVEDMSATQLNTGLFAQFASITNVA